MLEYNYKICQPKLQLKEKHSHFAFSMLSIVMTGTFSWHGPTSIVSCSEDRLVGELFNSLSMISGKVSYMLFLIPDLINET